MAPPVIQSSSNPSSSSSSAPKPSPRTGPSPPSSSRKPTGRQPQERRSELMCRIKWGNSLPDLPFDPKFLTYPFDSTRFVCYKPTSLEKSYRNDLVTEHDLGVAIDLINPDTYTVPEGGPELALAPEDEKLLEEDASSGSAGGGGGGHSGSHSTLSAINEKRSKQHNKVVPWLKKTEYISTEFNRYGASSEKNETKVGFNVRKRLKEEGDVSLDREAQIKAIDKTFEEAKKPLETLIHHKKGNTQNPVHPVAVYPLFPDFESWKYPFAQVTFDADPSGNHATASSGSENQRQVEEMSQAMIRGVMDDTGEQFVAYFLPTEETLRKRKRDAELGLEYDDEDEYEYRMEREYNWNVKNKSSKGYEENYFLVFKEEAVYYNELETRVRLTKRRTQSQVKAAPNNSKLIVKHRALNDVEFKTRDMRLTQLMPHPQEEEEKEEDEKPTKEQIKEQPKEDEDEDEDRPEAVPKKESPEKDEKKRTKTADKERSSGSESGSGSSGSESGSGSSSASESSSEEEEEEKEEEKKKAKAKQDEEEIFGSDVSDD